MEKDVKGQEDLPTEATEALLDAIEWKDVYKQATINVEQINSNNINSKTDYIVKLFTDVFLSHAYSLEDVVVLVNRYSRAINASNEFTEEEKDIILSGLATALYSYNYWSVENSKKGIYDLPKKTCKSDAVDR